MKNIKKLWVLLFAVSLSNCAHVPPRPKGEVCVIVSASVGAPVCACVDSESGEATRVLPIAKCDKYISIDPAYYLQLEDWIQELIQKVRMPMSYKKNLREALRKSNEIVEASSENAKKFQ